jgi:hypothetical protein
MSRVNIAADFKPITETRSRAWAPRRFVISRGAPLRDLLSDMDAKHVATIGAALLALAVFVHRFNVGASLAPTDAASPEIAAAEAPVRAAIPSPTLVNAPAAPMKIEAVAESGSNPGQIETSASANIDSNSTGAIRPSPPLPPRRHPIKK